MKRDDILEALRNISSDDIKKAMEMTEEDMLKVNMSTGHINSNLIGNSHSERCARYGCSGSTYGSHPYNNILTYCGKCQEEIRHVQSKYANRKKIVGKYRKRKK